MGIIALLYSVSSKTNLPVAGIWSIFSGSKKPTSQSQQLIYAAIQTLTGKPPKNIALYELALRHSSRANDEGSGTIGYNNNERLEFLGDAVLGAVIGEYLFKKFPLKDEGFLTETRARIVNRESLSSLAMQMGLNKLLDTSVKTRGGAKKSHTIHGDALEALIGAIFLDRGFDFAKDFIINRIIGEYVNFDDMMKTEYNPKSRLIEFTQRKGYSIQFQVIKETGMDHMKEFTCEVRVNDQVEGVGIGPSKKKAEQSAAQKAMEKLGL